ncbi:hypothetical protein M408DRAFT_330906 [Serendipita vermifera MAFF 305830]|uniref:DH domain-containing protein n=1 Tax=Serendipita vermifera MAFF 305830 TaxID=933852 RepID=A0A0C3B120_SERVB|nr:hypothetical protein M408DRAFT_330906 [Serendipita vermifera MAFF 305830]
MAAPSPRKFVPLAAGHDPSTSSRSVHNSTDISYTKRAFFAAVVVEEGVHGIGPDAQEVIAALGTRITEQTGTDVDQSTSAQPLAGSDAVDLHRSATTRKRAVTTNAQIQRSIGHKRTLTQTDALQDMIREMVTTERTYVKRLRILKQDYADPLRNFSKKKEEALLDKYKAKTLFGNVDQLLSANELFLIDLEKMIGPNGQMLVGGLGDVCLKHFRDKSAFDCYKLYYSKREEAQAIFEEEYAKGSKAGFHAYIERIKYSSSDLRNRIGLRELLAEPIQRIPRYTMMWQNIIKEMDDTNPQRAKLIEAEKIASKIAICESDDQTKRATTMYCLERTIEGFPPGLISNNRKFIDCIDVEDLPVDTMPASSAASTSSGGIGVLFCTLFLFDDRLIIVKRPNGTSSGRALARLDDIEKILRTNALNSVKKSGMSCKGVIDVLDVTATDVGGPDLHFYLENPPTGQTDRWNGRSFRSYGVVLPPSPINLDPTATQAAKRRFLENLWNVQALYRVKNGRCVAVRSEEVDIESKGGRTTQATAFYNLYQRTPYLGEARKHKVVVHVDPSREADTIPFGIVGGPFVLIRLQPMPGGLCRYNVTCNSPDEDEEEHIVHSEMVPGRIINTIHQFGLFSFRTGSVSRPNTPTATSRSRAAIFGLDAISRTLMGSSRSGGDVFSFGASVSGTIGTTKRSRGAMSRASAQTVSTAFTESTNRFSYRSNSTAATSFLGDESMSSLKSPRKLVKRGKSPAPGDTEEPSPDDSIDHSEAKRSLEIPGPPTPAKTDRFERDQDTRLELAKQNGLIQHALFSDTSSFMLRDPPFAETIYEEEPPASRVSHERRRTLLSVDIDEEEENQRPTSTTPTKSPITKSLPALPRKPAGPRRATLAAPKLADLQADDLDEALDETLAYFSPPQYPADLSDDDTPTRPTFEPILPAEGVFRTPTKSSTTSVEPLSIKKKTSVKPRKSPGSFRRIPVREPGSPSPSARRSSNGLQHTASMVRSPPNRSSVSGKEVERIVVVAKTTKEDLSSARRAMKRIKQEVEVLREDFANGRHDDRGGAISPTGNRGIVRSPPTMHIVNKAAEARMAEMRQMIERRGPAGSGLHRSPSIAVPSASSPLNANRLEQWTRTMESLVEDADKQIAQAIDQSEALVKDMALLSVRDDSSTRAELEKVRAELGNNVRQKDVLKQLLEDATAENEALYSMFNQELESMFEEINLPEDQAWSALINDLQAAKKTRNQLSKENLQYKQKLKLAEERNEELLALLRANGLDPGQ